MSFVHLGLAKKVHDDRAALDLDAKRVAHRLADLLLSAIGNGRVALPASVTDAELVDLGDAWCAITSKGLPTNVGIVAMLRRWPTFEVEKVWAIGTGPLEDLIATAQTRKRRADGPGLSGQELAARGLFPAFAAGVDNVVITGATRVAVATRGQRLTAWIIEPERYGADWTVTVDTSDGTILRKGLSLGADDPVPSDPGILAEIAVVAVSALLAHDQEARRLSPGIAKAGFAPGALMFPTVALQVQRAWTRLRERTTPLVPGACVRSGELAEAAGGPVEMLDDEPSVLCTIGLLAPQGSDFVVRDAALLAAGTGADHHERSGLR